MWIHCFKKKQLACVETKLAFSEEDEIAVLDADTKFLLMESFHLGNGLNYSRVWWKGENQLWLEISTEKWVLCLPSVFKKKDLLQLLEIKDSKQLF